MSATMKLALTSEMGDGVVEHHQGHPIPPSRLTPAEKAAEAINRAYREAAAAWTPVLHSDKFSGNIGTLAKQFLDAAEATRDQSKIEVAARSVMSGTFPEEEPHQRAKALIAQL